MNGSKKQAAYESLNAVLLLGLDKSRKFIKSSLSQIVKNAAKTNWNVWFYARNMIFLNRCGGRNNVSNQHKWKAVYWLKVLVLCLISLFLRPFWWVAHCSLAGTSLLAQTYQDQHEVKAAIDAQLSAQWTRLVLQIVRWTSRLFLNIQSGPSPLLLFRLASRKVSSGSDWIKGPIWAVVEVL